MKTLLSRTNLLREIRKMRFEEVYEGWQERRLTQEEAARVLGMSERNFRRHLGRYEADGLDGLIDRRIEQISSRRAPVDEVMRVVNLYQSRHDGWNVRHFHAWYRRDGVGTRSYSWLKNVLQAAAVVPRAKARGKHRRKRERRPLPGMLLHQDGSRHEWVAGAQWDLIVTLDDATGEHTSMFFVEEDASTPLSNRIGPRAEPRGCSFYTDRGSHYFHTPEAGGPVDRRRPTKVGRATETPCVNVLGF